MKLFVVASACLLAALTVSALKEEQTREKRNTISSISGSLSTAATIAGNVGTLIGATTAAIPLIGVFTGLFSFIAGLMQDQDAFWKQIEMRMREIAKEEVASYHDLLANNFVSNIKRSMVLYNRFPEKIKGQPNREKINEGVVLSGAINNGQQWVNLQVGKNPQRMITYFMEVMSLDVAVLYSNAALYGTSDRNHWIRLDERIGHHISDAEKGAGMVLTWRLKDDHFKCDRKQCPTSYRKCGPKASQRCANTVGCTTASDLLDEVTYTKSYNSRCGATACRRYRKVTESRTKTKLNTSNCDWYKAEIRAKTQAWLQKNVHKHVKMWKELKARALRNLGR